jgi:hypothetical protein
MPQLKKAVQALRITAQLMAASVTFKRAFLCMGAKTKPV